MKIKKDETVPPSVQHDSKTCFCCHIAYKTIYLIVLPELIDMNGIACYYLKHNYLPNLMICSNEITCEKTLAVGATLLSTTL